MNILWFYLVNRVGLCGILWKSVESSVDQEVLVSDMGLVMAETEEIIRFWVFWWWWWSTVGWLVLDLVGCLGL